MKQDYKLTLIGEIKRKTCSCIYKITSPLSLVYIGRAVNLSCRISLYRNNFLKHLKDYNHHGQILLMNSFAKYGIENHTIEVLEECEPCMLNEREIYYISKYKSYYKDNPNGMNLTKGGYGTMGRKMSEEHKAKLRMSQKPKSEEAKRMQHEMFRGKPSTRVGFKMTEEQKEKMRESHKTRPLTDLVIACRNSAKSKKIVYGYNFETKEKLEFKSIRKAGEYCKSISIARNILYNRYYKHPVFYFSFTDFNESNLINVIK